MKETGFYYSSYIQASQVRTAINAFMEKVTGALFGKIDFDSESLSTLKEYHSKGIVAYLSYQSTNTPLMIFVNLLRKHGFIVPVLSLDFTPNLVQLAANFFNSAVFLAKKISGKIKQEKISDYDYIIDTLRGGNAVILSLLSRKLFVRRYIERKSDTIQYLVEAQKCVERPIFLFPQILFWNQNPDRTRAFVTARATGDRGFFTGLFTVMRSSTPAFMRISMPINIKEEIERSPADDSRQIARKIRAKMLELYSQEKRTVLGPTIKSQQEMMEKVLYHKNVLDEIQAMMETDHQPENKLRKKAYQYFREIAADFSIVMIKWFNASVQYLFTKIFDGIYYDVDDLKRVREAAQHAPLVFVPSHKSHMDYLIISSIFYMNKIIPPHIVAGQNLMFFPMGKIFRKSGAFFMRRTFRGLKLYPTIFKQYIKTLMCEGYGIEVFIEGTRTRTGKLINPKMGVLSYLIEAIDEGYARDMIFVPITISYDRILEESTYHMELKGKEKETESTSTFVKSRKFLKRKYGKVYLSFNESFSFKEYRDKLGEGTDVTASLAQYIIRRIAEIVMATPFSITSSAMLLSSAKGFTREILKKRIGALHDYLVFTGVRMSDQLAKAANFDEIIDYVLESYMQDGIVGMPVAGTEGGAPAVLEGLYTLNENERSRINFYKNTIIHYFLPATFISILLLCSRDEKTEERRVAAGVADLMDIFSEEFVYLEFMLDTGAVVAKYIEYFAGRSVIVRENGMISIRPEGRDELILFAKAVQDFLESYLIVYDCAASMRKRMSRKELIYEARKNGIKLFHLGEVKLAESLSVPNYEKAIAWLKRGGILDSATDSGKKQDDMQMVNQDGLVKMKEKIEGYLRPLQKL